MPVNLPGLTSGLIDLAKSPPGVFVDGNLDIPGTFRACGQAWADAMQSYAAAILPASTTVAAATPTLATALTAAFATGAAAPGMASAFTAWAVTVGGGMAPGFVAVPPPVPPNFASLMTSNVATHELGGARFANLINIWLITGTATPSGGGPSIPWS